MSQNCGWFQDKGKLANAPFEFYRLWILKNAILEFFKRLNVSWERSYELSLLFIRITLVATFIAVVISDLAECQPFSHYWQVLPDPGPQCRQGYAQLMTMAVCNVVTDLLLVFFPVPIIIRSQMSIKRKFQLVLLFSLSLIVVAVTIYRVPHIIEDNGSQQSRSLYASVELLFATAASNALVLGSFVRDRGVKKRKFKYGSVAAGSMERSSASESRRPTMIRQWGSDEDLVRELGFGVKPDLREIPASTTENGYYTPAPMASELQKDMSTWQFPGSLQQPYRSSMRSDDYHLVMGERLTSTRSNSIATPRRVSFFDYGGLLNDQGGGRSRRASQISNINLNGPLSPVSGGAPSPTVAASQSGLRRGSTALLQDIGGFLSPLSARSMRPKFKAKSTGALATIPQQKAPPEDQPSSCPADGASENKNKSEPTLIDAGGLLTGSTSGGGDR